MIKNLNSNRASARPRLSNSSRSRCASNLCAALAAVLLLLSVSVLYSRLSYEGASANGSQMGHFSSFRLGFPSFVSNSKDRQSGNGVESEQDPNDDTDAVIDPGQHEVGEEKDDRIDSGLNPEFENEGFGELGEEVEDRIDEFDFFEEDYAVDSEDGADDKLNSSDSKLLTDKEDEVYRGSGVEEEDGEVKTPKEERKGGVGYFWDHVTGVTRRAFTKRGSGFDGWGDDNFFNSGEEDRSKLAFSSDDQPVDEGVRSKLGEVKRIEDALLLKTSGSGSSKLRDGWAPWFDNVQKRSSKGDFFRRDRMFRSNLDLLNPVNNPLLQDPDGAGVTVLTRGDKLIQKVLRSELDKTPFGRQNLLRTVAETGEFEVGRNEGVVKESGSGIKRVERRTLDDAAGSNLDWKDSVKGFESLGLIKEGKTGLDDLAADHGKKRSISPKQRTKRECLPSENNLRENSELFGSICKDKVKGADGLPGRQEIKRVTESPIVQTQLSSRADNKIRTKHHHHGDSQRWGYFPGLGRHLQFSEFMDRFFRYGKCSLQVFMVWNSPPWAYTVRYQRGLESFIYHHPDACVVVFSETIELEFFNDFVKDGYKIAVVMPNLDELLKNTPTHIFASVWLEWRKTHLYSIHSSELVRLAALYKYGGIYLDSDIIVLKPFCSLNDSVGMEDQSGGKMGLNGAVMAFKRNSAFIMECLREFYSTYDDTLLRWNGADLLERVVARLSRKGNDAHKQLELKIEPPIAFFPISSQNITRYFQAPADETERGLQENLFRRILDGSLAFHFWNSLTSALVPEPGSLVERLINHRCLRCLDIL